jgi:formylglycine-generating enzyme required for sulfatase activity
MNAPEDSGYAWHPLADGNPPDWVSEWGHDRFGVFIAFTLGEVTQRLRWIPPGRFEMGSPESEDGRFSDEGPQHWVTLEQGFWLFDTPCTQALWEVVMGKNPSRFTDPDRPVEKVSWDDAKGFIEAINNWIPGLALSLPSESQWEYACRAGTQEAIYQTETAMLGDVVDSLNSIAWYSANSGSETHPVAGKCPNLWGLYDMLGNVWEWVEDDWRDSYQGAPADGRPWLAPQAPGNRGAGRVVRGGSWNFDARYVRAAFRDGYVPVARGDYLGCRWARGQERAPGPGR